MYESLRRLSDRAEFFLVVTISFGYLVIASLSALLSGVRRFEYTTGGVVVGIAMEIATLAVVLSILRARGWTLERLTGRLTFPAAVAGIPLFMAFAFLYAGLATTVLALYPNARHAMSMRIVPTAPVALMLAFVVLNSIWEELLVTGYVVSALEKQGPALAITASTLLRLLYHLYQGPVATLSILPLGLIFAAVYWKWRNVWPLVAAHTITNVLSLLASR